MNNKPTVNLFLYARWLRYHPTGLGSWCRESATFVKILAILLPTLALCACAHAVRDTNRPAAPARRIVSLVPSLTEDLCAIGARSQLAGVSAHSDDIGGCTKGVPVVANFASVDAERIVELRPDLVVGIPLQREMTEPLRRANIRAAFLKDDSYQDLFDDIAALGKLTGRTAQARELAASLRKRTDDLHASEHFRRHPSVFVVLQAQPIWTVGPQSYISTLIELAGGRNAVQSLPQAYAEYSAEALVRLQPDAIVSTGTTTLRDALGREPWRSLRAVRERRVYILENDAILARPGPRYNEGVAWLIARLRPLAQ